MRWRLILEELSLELIYIKGSKCIVADALSRLDKIDNLNNTISGNFHFDAYNGTGEYTVNVSEGIFYKIPVNSEVQD